MTGLDKKIKIKIQESSLIFVFTQDLSDIVLPKINILGDNPCFHSVSIPIFITVDRELNFLE